MSSPISTNGTHSSHSHLDCMPRHWKLLVKKITQITVLNWIWIIYNWIWIIYIRPSKRNHHLPNAPKEGSHRHSTDCFLSNLLFFSSWFQEILKCPVSLPGAIVQQIGNCHLQEDFKPMVKTVVFNSLYRIVSSHRYVIRFVVVNVFLLDSLAHFYFCFSRFRVNLVISSTETHFLSSFPEIGEVYETLLLCNLIFLFSIRSSIKCCIFDGFPLKRIYAFSPML